MNPAGRPKLATKEKRESLSILVRFNADEAKRIRRANMGDKLPAQWARERLLEASKA